ncbi:MAG: NusA-like transcription termination signal-binding factor [Nanoarchaeota archaeon]
MKIKYDNEVIKVMSLFNSITQARLKDYFVDGNGLPVFVVQEKEIGKAVGKKGANVRLLEEKLNRKIKIIEFNPDVLKFAKNLVYPMKLENAEVEGKILTLQPEDKKSRGLLIGRAAKNLRNIEKIIKRYFDVDEVKID